MKRVELANPFPFAMACPVKPTENPSSRRDGESSRPADGISTAVRVFGILDSIF